jgi:hypothetical protein
MTDLQILEHALYQLGLNYEKTEDESGIEIELSEDTEEKVCKGDEYGCFSFFSFEKDGRLKYISFTGA